VDCVWDKPIETFNMKRAEEFAQTYCNKHTPNEIVIDMWFVEGFIDPFVIYEGFEEFVGLRIIQAEYIPTQISTDRKVKVTITKK
jgi:hypothetical protein